MLQNIRKMVDRKTPQDSWSKVHTHFLPVIPSNNNLGTAVKEVCKHN